MDMCMYLYKHSLYTYIYVCVFIHTYTHCSFTNGLFMYKASWKLKYPETFVVKFCGLHFGVSTTPV